MTRRRILGLTGTRAEFGLLEPVFRAIGARSELELLVAVTGTHLLPGGTRSEVAAAVPIAAEFAMQAPGEVGRLADAAALGRGILGMAKVLETLRPDWVVVLGDRIEAFAGASAAAIGGVRVAHLHGGDRAEGVADEGMRHAIAKLAHLHLAATAESAERLRRMGEEEERIHVVGSPAIDGLAGIPPLDEATFVELGRPDIVFLLHPTGRDDGLERSDAAALLAACRRHGRVLAMDPNHDPGSNGIRDAIAASGVGRLPHLPRARWVGLLRRIRLLAGNSSAGLIEAAAIGVPVLDLGTRQGGRERPGNVRHVDQASEPTLAAAIGELLARPRFQGPHPYGDGRTGERVATLLATPEVGSLRLAKRNAY